MAWGDREASRERRGSSLEAFLSPWAFRAGPLNITVREDELRRAIRGRVASFALIGRKTACPTLASSISTVMLIVDRFECSPGRVKSLKVTYMDAPACQAIFSVLDPRVESAALHSACVCETRLAGPDGMCWSMPHLLQGLLRSELPCRLNRPRSDLWVPSR
jgi:hypothetical protein